MPEKVQLEQNKLAQRRYPWGDEADLNRANYDKTRINDTSAAGCFPADKSPYGCEEMVGNVWEWTRSLWGEDPLYPKFNYPYIVIDGRENLKACDRILRVLRGGSFNTNQVYLRGSARNGNNPVRKYNGLGFRVVISPFS